MAFKLLAPAKVNLSLKVLRRRADGYHEIDTVLQSIDLCDEITIELTGAGLRLYAPPHLPAGEENLCYRAAQAYFVRARRRAQASIWLTKNVPVQAGLGGGSSNAAAVLLGLNQLHDSLLRPEELGEMAATLGSDVPFFLTGGTARARGRGEQVEALSDGQEWWLRIVMPPLGLSTQQVYALWRPGREDVFPAELFFNDLERSAHILMPELHALYRLLALDGAARVLLCGSGSAVCGFFSSPPRGEWKLASGHREFVARTITRAQYREATTLRECESPHDPHQTRQL